MIKHAEECDIEIFAEYQMTENTVGEATTAITLINTNAKAGSIYI